MDGMVPQFVIKIIHSDDIYSAKYHERNTIEFSSCCQSCSGQCQDMSICAKCHLRALQDKNIPDSVDSLCAADTTKCTANVQKLGNVYILNRQNTE